MRAAVLFPLALVTLALVGCGGDVTNLSEQEQSASRTAALERDLTLSVPQVPAAEVASAVELALPKPLALPRRHWPRPKPKSAPSAAAVPAPEAAAEPTPKPVTVPAVSEALVEPAATDEASAHARELAPGKTITVIPVASGPSVEADGDDSWLPSERPRGVVAGGGGTCRRRGGGGGIGIAARFRVSLPVLRLR